MNLKEGFARYFHFPILSVFLAAASLPLEQREEGRCVEAGVPHWLSSCTQGTGLPAASHLCWAGVEE